MYFNTLHELQQLVLITIFPQLEVDAMLRIGQGYCRAYIGNLIRLFPRT